MSLDKDISVEDFKKNYYYIVDTSYIIFCTAAVAFNEYCYQEDVLDSALGPSFDPTVDPEFNYIFENALIKKIERQCKIGNPLVFKRSNIFFTLDCPRTEIWRRSIYPEYKLTRDTADKSKNKFDIGRAFAYAYSYIIPKYCSETGAKIIKCTGAESDDIIAILSKWLIEKDKNNYVIILSSDRDMIQLCNDHVSVIANKNVKRDPKLDLIAMTNVDNIDEEITADDFLLFKIIIGDKSDNIPAIKKLLGPKKALQFIVDKSHEKLKKLLNEDALIKKSFIRNKKLISMNLIPDELKTLIIENIEESMNSSKVNTDEGEVDLDKLLEINYD